tara:strand:- start:419 stop:520 length:102 start_codon:yes stop_codon:yes gene_type:complete
LEEASIWMMTDAEIETVSAFTTGADEIAAEKIE